MTKTKAPQAVSDVPVAVPPPAVSLAPAVKKECRRCKETREKESMSRTPFGHQVKFPWGILLEFPPHRHGYTIEEFAFVLDSTLDG